MRQDVRVREGFGRLPWAPLAFVPIWASGFVVARLAMPHVPPFGFLAWRFALSALVFLAWLMWARPRWPQTPEGDLDRRTLKWLAVTGALVHFGYLGGVWTAVRLGMGAALVALLMGLQPILTAAWASVRQGQRLPARGWLGLAFGLGGVALAVAHKLGQGEVHAGNLLCAALALAAITAGTLVQKAKVPPVDFRVAQLVQTAASFPLALLAAQVEPGAMPLPPLWHADVVVAMAWSVLGLTLGGSSLLFALVARGAATQVTSLLYLVPPVTALLAWVLFRDPLGWGVAAGVVLTAMGVWLVHHTPAATRPQPASR